ncbi:MAG: MarR family transcriptional regulator [Calditrichaeota bacterium]|nr:MAG: MarR family transcriptional regulator [Calditrichota bacterium]MBL1205893.1 MarR family transcriptional regulator [Calditrichota bacterium]NOG45721.1 MarR family transcriptional regulator [Calditrichota bacterium]
MKETFDYHIKSTWHLLAKMYNLKAMQHDISQVIGYVLINIEKGGTPVTQLASLLGVESTSLSRLLKSIEEKGLIERTTCEDDRRVMRVFLTKEGIAKRKKASEIILSFNDKMARRLSKPEKDNFLKIFNHVKELIQEEIDEIQAMDRET